jgi:hypothetical protein
VRSARRAAPRLRPRRTTLGGTGLDLAALVSVGAAQPASAAATCQLDAQSLKALDLNDNDGTDEVLLRLAGTRTPVQTYVLNQKRLNLGVKVFQGSIDLDIVEKDNGQTTTIGSVNNIQCQNRPLTTKDRRGFGAIYRVAYSVK